MSFKMPGSQSNMLLLRQKCEELQAVPGRSSPWPVPHGHPELALTSLLLWLPLGREGAAQVEWRVQKAEAQLCVESSMGA